MSDIDTVNTPRTAADTSAALQKKLAFYRAWETLINKISPQVCSAINLDGFLQATVDEIGRIMDVDRCTLMVYAAKGTLKIDYEHLRDDDLPSALNLEIPVNRDFLLSSSYHREPFGVDDVQTRDVHPVLRQLCTAFGTRSLLVVPVTLGEQLLALIGLHHSRRVHRWDDDERNFMISLANQLAVAYQYTRLYTEKEREVRVSGLLLSLIDELHRERNMDQVIAFLLDNVLELVTAESGCFGYFEMQGHMVHFTIQRRLSPDSPPLPDTLPLAPDTALFAELRQGKRVFVTDDSHLAHDGYRLRKLFGASSLLVAPLLINRALFGVMVFLWHGPTGTPREGDQVLLESVLRQAAMYFERNQLVAEILHLKKRLQEVQQGDHLVGSNPVFQEAVREALDLAPSEVTLCIRGENGTGRSLLAELVHRHSLRETAPFRKIPCRHLDPSQFREKVFGRTFQDSGGKEYFVPGAIEAALGGTLFFHEVDRLPRESQLDLLEFLRNGYVFPEGTRRRVFRNHRLLFSVATGAEERVSDGTLERALWELIAVRTVELPPLRRRTEDIPLLVNFFLDAVRKETGRYIAGLDSAALRALGEYSWPGNVRELRAVMEKTALRATGPLITLRDIGRALPRLDGGEPAIQRISLPVGQPLAEVEKTMIRETLVAFDGDKKHAAAALGISRRTLYRKLEQYGLDEDNPPASSS